MNIDAVTLVAALGGGAGISAVIQATTTVIRLVRRGVSVREGKRRVDIVQQRDEALQAAHKERERADAQQARADAEQQRADWADANRQIAVENEQRAREHAADLRVRLIEAGQSRDRLPEWPDMDRTIPRAEFDRLRKNTPPAAD
ncbi:hypothetical protein [Curtobacterium sp. MCBD17_008]|uniref:hypothetical protein n=1 Tax=Curtobacterium sp. MCBD17_008 TaxID=2175656 RepID=UPI000DA975A3|nr:hypothetical protein [Curtobacterium sp. MCBD17_008]PZE89930.1 hypothetical protein DEI95_12980 [Curtobacterium sp. MCBD17_008]